MENLTTLIWAITALLLAIFLNYWFLPFIRTKWLLKYYGWRVRRMAKKAKKDGKAELSSSLTQLADLMEELDENEKLEDQ